MVTHREDYEVQTAVQIPGSEGTWEACASLPDVLGEDMIKTCDDLSRVLVTQGGVVSRLLRGLTLGGFRLLARERRSAALVGAVEWVQHPCGMWVQHGTPVTGCEYGQHGPAARSALRLVA
ncbi:MULTISPECIES: hypothetical protein [Streptomyces]|uniref:hypothetical protein n=1 Tax=Streptomyces TaxID=1883 RepID=UPI0010221D61|nr:MULTISPECIES: hypothetical protein [Streptomyces]RZE84501.1 hypothetical protein C0Q99_01615 [Streptomyces albidoflavus]